MSAFKPDYILFSDASLRTEKEDKSVRYSAYGVIVLNTKNDKYIKFGGQLGTNSIVFAEAWGIYKALSTLISYVGSKKEINVLMVTDSKLNVQIIGDYIPNKWNTYDWYHWIKADGEPVKNQYIYRKIYGLLIDHPNVNFKIIHINSHMRVSDALYVQTKLHSHNVTIDRSTAQALISLNAIVDHIAASETNKMKEESSDGFYRLIREEGFEYVR